jgi:uncharacterized protein YecT (DUF1311 family)
MRNLYLTLILLPACPVAFAQTQMEINQEAADKYKKADLDLNKVYKQLMSITKDQKKKDLLIKAQRAWIIYKEAHCNYEESFYEGGSMQPTVYFSCLQEVTEERIKQLKVAIEENKDK